MANQPKITLINRKKLIIIIEKEDKKDKKTIVK